MKKIAIFFFAAVYCIFLSAMETQPDYQSGYALYSRPYNPYEQSGYSPDSQSYNHGEQSSYVIYSQQYNNVIYDPESNMTPPPHYNSLNTGFFVQPGISQESEPLLQTFVSNDNINNLNQEIYKKARLFVECYMRNPVTSIISDVRLTELITQINDAKAKGLFQDDIGRLGIKESPKTTLFFYYLRSYFLTVSYSQESIPVLEKGKTTYAILMQFPAYVMLVDSLISILKQKQNDVVIVASYLHANDNIIFDLLEDISSNNNNDLVSEIYTKAYDLFLGDDKNLIMERVHELVQMIENAKRANLIDHEYALSFEIEDFEPEDAFLTNVKSLINKKYSIDNIKNRIKVLLDLISKYLDGKLDKSTPTIKQIKLRDAMQNINILLSEQASNMLNEANYAFYGFDVLVKEVESLISSDDESVLQQVKNIMLNF